MAHPATLIDFCNKLRDVGVKLTHHYQLSFSGLPDGGVEKALEDITMYAKSATIPGITQNDADVTYAGIPFSIPTNFEMTQEMSFEVIADRENIIHDNLVFWFTEFANPDINGGSMGGGNKRVPTAECFLDLFDDTYQNVTDTFRLAGVMPTKVGNVTVSNVDPNVATFPVTIQFQYFVKE
jgi:hypothetical protein